MDTNSDDIGSVSLHPPKEVKPKAKTYDVEVAYSNSITAAIIVLTVVIIGSFIIYLLILVFNDVPPATIAECLPDRCATNIVSGVKRCPPPGESITYNTDIEVCNSRFVCDSSVTPLAVQLDGSTNIDGICPNDVECRCLTSGNNTVPTYIVSTYKGINGNPYTSLANQRLTFTQDLIPPLTEIPNITSDFYSTPSTWLARSSPGCFDFPISINFESSSADTQRESLKKCFNDINPCLQGALAYIPTNESQQINSNQLNFMGLSCVRAKPCISQLDNDGRNYILIRDYLSGEFLCYNVDDMQ